MSKEKDYEYAELIDDSSESETEINEHTNTNINEERETSENVGKKKKVIKSKIKSKDEEKIEKMETSKSKKREKKATTKTKVLLEKFYSENKNIYEIGVDEAGRGPLFGRVYTAAVVLPKDDSFDHSKVKDSKKFHSKEKIEEAAEYVKKNAIAWSVNFEDETVIDNINILQATQKSMHNSIKCTIRNLGEDKDVYLLIDGNYFNAITHFNKEKECIEHIPYTCVEGGDNKFSCIAAASILAKVARDQYIEELCKEYPYLTEKYDISNNKGYGAKKHIDGIKEHGISIWHRKTFGICKNF